MEGLKQIQTDNVWERDGFVVWCLQITDHSSIVPADRQPELYLWVWKPECFYRCLTLQQCTPHTHSLLTGKSKNSLFSVPGINIVNGTTASYFQKRNPSVCCFNVQESTMRVTLMVDLLCVPLHTVWMHFLAVKLYTDCSSCVVIQLLRMSSPGRPSANRAEPVAW